MMIQMEENGMEVDWSTLDEDDVVFPFEIMGWYEWYIFWQTNGRNKRCYGVT